MLEAGRALALEAGAALTIEHLRLEEVIQRARVPRSSVYRMWPYREDYTDDLLCYLAGEGSWFSDRTVLDPETSTVVGKVLAENTELLATVEGRRALVCEVVRLTIVRNYESLTGSTPWRLHMALVATLGSTRSGLARKRIAAALEDAQRRSRESMVAVLSLLADALGLRLRDPAYTLDHVQLAGGLLIQSLALRNVQVQAAVDSPDAADGDGGADRNGAGDGDGDGGTSSTGGTGSAAGGAGARRGASAADASAADASGADASGAASGGGAGAGLPPAAGVVNGLLNAPVPGPGLHGGQADWSLAGLAYLGVLDAFMELDPDFTPPSS